MAAPTTFTERIRQWAEQFVRDLRKHWWWVFIIGPSFAFIWLLLVDRVIGFANKYIDNHLSLSVFKPIALTLWNSAITKPLFALTAGVLIPFATMLVHAYLETRATQNKPALLAHFVRSHLMPRSPWQSMVEGVFEAVGRTNYKVECDFLHEVFLVNTTENQVTVKKFVAEVQVGQEWKELKRLEDLTDYKIQVGEDSRGPKKDLVSLAKTLENVPLMRGVGHRGWLRFEFVTEKKNLEGQVHSKVKIIDALGGEHEVAASEPRDISEGELIHNPDKVFEH